MIVLCCDSIDLIQIDLGDSLLLHTKAVRRRSPRDRKSLRAV